MWGVISERCSQRNSSGLYMSTIYELNSQMKTNFMRRNKKKDTHNAKRKTFEMATHQHFENILFCAVKMSFVSVRSAEFQSVCKLILPFDEAEKKCDVFCCEIPCYARILMGFIVQVPSLSQNENANDDDVLVVVGDREDNKKNSVQQVARHIHIFNGNGGLKYPPESTHQSERDEWCLGEHFTIATMLSETYACLSIFFLIFQTWKMKWNKKKEPTQQKLSQRSHRFTFLGLWILNANYEIHDFLRCCCCCCCGTTLWQPVEMKSQTNRFSGEVFFLLGFAAGSASCALMLWNLVQDIFKF